MERKHFVAALRIRHILQSAEMFFFAFRIQPASIGGRLSLTHSPSSLSILPPFFNPLFSEQKKEED